MYGICDIGSNTIVLNIYDLKQNTPVILKHLSTPCRLISYVKDGIMSKEGIQIAKETMLKYKNILDEEGISFRCADITEPCRIKNQEELLNALKPIGFKLYPLSGQMEATLDFIGARLTYPKSENGIAFDVGGGSSELISFANGNAIDAISIPLGCIRLAELPLDTSAPKEVLKQIQIKYPSLNVECEKLIGIGGTMRATTYIADELYHCGSEVPTHIIKEIYARLKNEEAEAIQAKEKHVKKSRQKVLLPGLGMILAILDTFNAQMVLYSKSGVREGFLLHCIEDNS